MSEGTLTPQAEDEIFLELKIINKKGLHARASAKFVQCVENFSDCEIEVTRCGETVGGLSIMGLMMLNAAQGSTISLRARGREAKPVLDALTALIDNKFGEGE
jgi:phosphocarrier protein HPr